MEIKAYPNETLDSLIERYNNHNNKEEISYEYRRREFFEKPSVIKNRKNREIKKRMKRKIQKEKERAKRIF